MALPLQLLLLFAVGVLTGFINILAGGGSLLTLPVLIFLGLPASVANGTNRIAILIQNFVAISGFHRFKVLPWKMGFYAAIPALAGSLVGANLAIDIPDALFKRILALVMVMVLLVILIDPSKRIRVAGGEMSPLKKLAFALAFFAIGVYGGFIQAGVGFLIITTALLAGFDMVATNALKVLVVFLFTILALAVFVYNGKVNILLGLGLGAGNATGAWIATHFAVKKGHAWVRGFVIVMVVIFALKLLLEP